MNDQDKNAYQAEIARLNETIKWYQGQAGQRIGEAARAGMVGAPVASVPQLRKATSELTLKELAAEFAAVAELGCDYTISAGVCAKLFEAMTTPPASVPQLAVPQGPVDGVHWDLFPSYLIDHREGSTITEEGLQFALADMLKDRDYVRVADARAHFLVAPAAAPLPELTGPSAAQRAAFEAEARKRGHLDLSRVPTSGCYRDDAVQDAWRLTLATLAASPSPAPAQQQEPIIFGIDYSGDYLAEVRNKALEEAAVVVLQGPFAGTRAGDAAAIRALKSSKSVETAAPGGEHRG